MKKFRITSCGAAAALVLLAGCDEGMYEGNGTGTISPQVSYDPTVVAARSAGSRVAEFDDLTVDDLTITLTSADGKVHDEFPYADFPAGRGYAVGKYTMTAYYGNSDEEGFEKPAVFGSTELTVNEGKTTLVELVAKPSKAMVGIRFDESVTSYMTDLSATLHSAGGQYITYSTDETRYAYLKPGQVTVDVTFTKPNGKGGTLQVAGFSAQAQHRYTLDVKLGGDGVGEVNSLTVKFDETLEQDSVTIDISDEILTVPAPEIATAGFTPGDIISVVEGSSLPGQLRYEINARGGIKSAVLTTSGTSLLELGWPAEIDLANATPQQQQQLTDLGFKDLGVLRNPGKMAAFELTDVVKHIPATAETASPVTFSLMVTDKNGKTSGEQPVGFSVKVDKLALTLEAVEGFAYAGEPTVDVLVGYNGTEPLQNLLTVKYLNENGIFKAATIANVAAQSRATQTYVVTVNVPSDAKLPIVFKAEAGSVNTGEITIPNASAPVLSVNNNDVFARKAIATLSSPDYDCSQKNIELYVSTDGTNFTKASGSQSGADFSISGLNPATSYTLRAKVGALTSNTVTITTEAANQIANGNLNDGWSSESRNSGAAKGTFHFAPSPWNTLNEVSFSDKAMLSSYSMLSCTEPTTDARSGNAALIRTVGYGNNSLATTPDHYTHGELYLGTYNGGAAYGVDFTTRPSALSFWYKYSRYTSTESGVAEVKVLDASGNVIASGSQLLAEASAYTNCQISLSYARGAAKAAKIQVVFKSSNETAGSGSVKANKSDYSYGAALYVDDVELVY